MDLLPGYDPRKMLAPRSLPACGRGPTLKDRCSSSAPAEHSHRLDRQPACRVTLQACPALASSWTGIIRGPRSPFRSHQPDCSFLLASRHAARRFSRTGPAAGLAVVAPTDRDRTDEAISQSVSTTRSSLPKKERQLPQYGQPLESLFSPDGSARRKEVISRRGAEGRAALWYLLQR